MNKELIQTKKAVLENARTALKAHFIGLDKVIDQVVDSITHWYLFPHLQQRPTVVCMWGLTGFGKSDLVNRLKDLLGMENRFIKFDAGEENITLDGGDNDFSGLFPASLKGVFVKAFKQFNEESPIICFDEFQHAKTIEIEKGQRKSKEKQDKRIIWELLDNGKFTYSHYLGSRDYYYRRCLDKIEHVETLEDHLIVQKGVVKSGIEELKDYATINIDGFGKKRKPGIRYFQTKGFLEDFLRIAKIKYITLDQLRDAVRQTSSLGAIKEILQEIAFSANKTETMDLSKSLIFALGNLDDAFLMAQNLNPDISADDIAEKVSKITIVEVKEALQNLFRLEQIGRLGNNHVIYPALDNAGFKAVIQKELDRIVVEAKEEYNIALNFEDSVVDMLYKETVFPTQGVRPVLRTVGRIVGNYLTRYICDATEDNSLSNKITFDFITTHLLKKPCFKITGAGSNAYAGMYELNLQLTSLRQSKNDNKQAWVAVHEAGHAIAYWVKIGLLPKAIYSKTASADAEGYVQYEENEVPTFQYFKDRITIALAGRAAEEVIFGKEMVTPGAESDFVYVTNIANAMFKSWGMGGSKKHLIPSSYAQFDSPLDNKDSEAQTVAQALIAECYKAAKELLAKEQTFFLLVAGYLSKETSMSPETFGEMAKEFCKSRKEVIDKKSLFPAKAILAKKLAEISTAEWGVG